MNEAADVSGLIISSSGGMALDFENKEIVIFDPPLSAKEIRVAKRTGQLPRGR